DGFYAPQAAETKDAFAKLQRRVPLGATSLQPALDAALKAFAGSSGADRGRSIIYIGDGMSTGKLVDMQEFRALISQLRTRQIPVNSFAVGPRTDLQVLGVLAQHTGGVVLVDALVDDSKQTPEKLGQKLAAAADAPVFYPETISLAPQADKLLPGVVPPIRSDRDTILLGKGRVGESLKVAVTGERGSLTWSVKPAPAQAGNTFLAGLWNLAEQSDGLLVAVAGSELLNEARQEYEGQVQELVAQGRQAVAARDLKQAEQIAHAVRQIDPANVQAETILNASQKVKAASVALARMQHEEPSEGPPAPGIAGDEAPATAKDTNLLDDERALRAIRAERLAKEVSRTIDVANKSGTRDPGSALGELKRALTAVISSNDIDPDIREKLRGKVQASIDRLLVARDKIEMDRISGLERASATRAREMATEQLVLRDEQLEQLIAKVSSLMYEGYIGNPDAFERAEEVARASFELAPYAGVTSAAIFDAEAAGQLDKAQRLRYRRYDMFLATLHQVEMAHIPFPDEPPIVYPAPEVWKSLTERRQKWASVDLMRWNPTEEKIRRSLDKPTNVEFSDLALEDAIAYLGEFHGINIWLDKQTLTDEGVALDQPVTLKLAQVSLRSVLKLLLEPVQLTYVIENEVMKITTSTKAGEKLSTRVYPVGDLVIPIITPRAGGGGMGMMGGGMGGGGMGGGM
ncbi:MAG TPA: vWA domain-containing protein, partial [Pirellulales bacterium]|nr:vWA domain-containing protein [Pirellulales bacterium]